MKQLAIILIWTFGCVWNTAKAFTSKKHAISYKTTASHDGTNSLMLRMPCLYSTADEQLPVESLPRQENEVDKSKLDAFLEKRYKSFYKLVNDEMMKTIKKGSVTVFVPNDAVFEALGERKLKQLEDPRNDEIKEKMGSYHIVPEPISAIELRTEDWSKGRPKDGSKPSKYEMKILPNPTLPDY
jgi:uncharacterized surface protein with fasciclin (FAS1) repeats